MACRGFLLVPVHMGVCCAGGVPAGCCRLLCVVCFLFCACVPLLTVWMLCSSYLYSGFFCATPDAYSALCLALHCTAPLDVSKSLTRMARQHHHENLSQHTLRPQWAQAGPQAWHGHWLWCTAARAPATVKHLHRLGKTASVLAHQIRSLHCVK